MKRKNLLTIAIAVVLSFGACNTTGDSPVQKPGNPTVTLWSPPATQKIMRDKEFENKDPAILKYEMSKNEIEGAQVIITPENDYKVGSFTVEVSDLQGADGAMISKDAVEVYLQKYVRIDRQVNYNKAYGPGYQPDPLLPFDIAVEYGENTVVGKNQGLYVTVQTQKDTPAGTYTGNMEIKIDGKTYNVPMSVEVWDFAISDEVHAKSLFALWTSEFMQFELDASDEMYEAYVKALNEYRLSVTNFKLPDEAEGNMELTISEFIKKAKEATKNPKVSAYDIPAEFFENNKANLKVLFKQMILESTADVCLMDKLVIYFSSTIDEPNLAPERKPKVNPCALAVDEATKEVFSELEEEGFFDSLDTDYVEHLRETVLTIPMIVTAPYDSDYLDGELTYCPTFNNFHLESNREIYADQQAKNGELWWYGHKGPCYPYPTYHLDDHLVGARILSWMQYGYGIDGNLYWLANEFDAKNESLYDATYGHSDNNGDGYLFYPGVEYGVYGPIGSMRLQTIRDGLEDYEYLYELGKKTEELSKYYAETISEIDMLQPLFNRLYTGTMYETDNYNFYEVRREVVNIMKRCSADEKFVLKELSYSADTATIVFNVANDYSVKVNGAEIQGMAQGQGKTYKATIKLDKAENLFNIEMENGENKAEFTVDAGKETRVLATFADTAELAFVSDNNDAITITQVNADAWNEGVTAAKVEVVSTFDPNNPLASLTYRPEVIFDLSQSDCKVSDLATVRWRIYNDSGMELDVQFAMRTKFGQDLFFVSATKLKPGWNVISAEGIEKHNSTKLKDVTKFVLLFQNTVNGENQEAMPKQTVYIDEILIAYTGKEGQ